MPRMTVKTEQHLVMSPRGCQCQDGQTDWLSVAK